MFRERLKKSKIHLRIKCFRQPFRKSKTHVRMKSILQSFLEILNRFMKKYSRKSFRNLKYIKENITRKTFRKLK